MIKASESFLYCFYSFYSFYKDYVCFYNCFYVVCTRLVNTLVRGGNCTLGVTVGVYLGLRAGSRVADVSVIQE